MKLTLKLPLAFAVALLLALCASSFGIYSLNQSLAAYATTVRVSSESAYATKDVESAFKTQVQEWKNILLRGKDPEAFAKHVKGFEEQAGHVKKNLREFEKHVTELGLEKAVSVGSVLAMLDKLDADYKEALKSYHAGTDDPATVVEEVVE